MPAVVDEVGGLGGGAEGPEPGRAGPEPWPDAVL